MRVTGEERIWGWCLEVMKWAIGDFEGRSFCCVFGPPQIVRISFSFKG